MKKRAISLLLSLLMVFSLLPFGATAADIVDSGTCGENVTWTLDSDGLLTISGSGAMTDYSIDGPPPYRSNNIHSVVIEPGVTRIGSHAFYGCRSMTSVTIPDSVISIGTWAFFSCPCLESIVIPDSITLIPVGAFHSCSNLKSVVIPNSVTIIGQGAFNECTGLESITIPDSVTTIVDQAFRNCSSLKTIVIPDGVKTIALRTFEGCRSLTSVTIPDGVTSIEYYAFYGCSSLTNMTIPSSVTSIESSAFYGCSSLTNVTIPDGVTTIGYSAFSGCSGLTGSVTIPNSVTSIGSSAFSGCTSLSELTFPENVRVIPDKVCEGCTALENVTLGSRVETINDYAFYRCSSLKSVTLTDALKTVNIGAFRDCDALADVNYNGSEASWNSITIKNYNEPLLNAELHVNEPHTHDTELRGTKAATCTQDGYTGDEVCRTCGEIVMKGSVIKAAGHKWDAGKVTKEPTETAKGVKTFTCTVCKATRTESIPKLTPTKPANPFTDVKTGAFYYDPVLWAVSHDPQITKGVSDTAFAPGETCTRGQVVTFLWRAMGCPEPKSANNPFTDVKEGAFYYKAVLWAAENCVTTGATKTTFAPGEACTRAHVVTFLWRAHEKPAAGQSNPFTDVKAGQYYSDAVLWAVSKDITKGMTATTFAPDEPCTRGQIVTFLYRDMK
jgi:hypothetical protein